MPIIHWNKSDITPQELYALRQEDYAGLLLDSITPQEIETDPDNETGIIHFDALVVTNAKLEQKADLLTRLMKGKSVAVDVETYQVTEPFKRNGTVNRAIVFELTDGQTISVYLHNPDTNDKALKPGDELVSWKWLLNKRDVTIVVAPEKGKDLAVRDVCIRLMKLAGKNSEAFARANTKRASTLKEIEDLKKAIPQKEVVLKDLLAQLADKQANADNQASWQAAKTVIFRRNNEETAFADWLDLFSDETRFVLTEPDIIEFTDPVNRSSKIINQQYSGAAFTFLMTALSQGYNTVGQLRQAYGITMPKQGRSAFIELLYKAMANQGWVTSAHGSFNKTFTGAQATGGSVNPNGDLILSATLNADQSGLVLQRGWEDVFTLPFDELAADAYAKAFNQKTQEYIDTLKTKLNPQSGSEDVMKQFSNKARNSGTQAWLDKYQVTEAHAAQLLNTFKTEGTTLFYLVSRDLNPDISEWQSTAFADTIEKSFWDVDPAQVKKLSAMAFSDLIHKEDEVGQAAYQVLRRSTNKDEIKFAQSFGKRKYSHASYPQSKQKLLELAQRYADHERGETSDVIPTASSKKPSPEIPQPLVIMNNRLAALGFAQAGQGVWTKGDWTMRYQAEQSTDYNSQYILERSVSGVIRTIASYYIGNHDDFLLAEVNKETAGLPDLLTAYDNPAALNLEADRLAQYTAFDARSIKMPTAVQLGMNVERGLCCLADAGQTPYPQFWSNGHLLDLKSRPTVVKNGIDKYLNGQLDEANARVVSLEKVQQLVNDAMAGATVEVLPAVSYDSQSRRKRNYMALADATATLFVNLDKDYFAYFFKAYPGCTFYAENALKAVLIKHEGQAIGLIMPAHDAAHLPYLKSRLASSSAQSPATAKSQDASQRDFLQAIVDGKVDASSGEDYNQLRQIIQTIQPEHPLYGLLMQAVKAVSDAVGRTLNGGNA